LDFYEEDKETLSGTTTVFYCSGLYGINALKIPYRNTTTVSGNFSLPDWWETKTMWVGLYLSFSELFTILGEENHSTSVTLHSPKLFESPEIHGFPSKQTGFGSIEIVISSLVFCYLIFKKKVDQ